MVALEENPSYFENVADKVTILTDFRSAAKKNECTRLVT